MSVFDLVFTFLNIKEKNIYQNNRKPHNSNFAQFKVYLKQRFDIKFRRALQFRSDFSTTLSSFFGLFWMIRLIFFNQKWALFSWCHLGDISAQI